MRRHELLSPAGSLEICKAVLNAGADAVYLGGDKFGARAFAKNFTQNDIQEALDFAHMRGKKIFLTVNTLLKNKEIETELFSYLKPVCAWIRCSHCAGLRCISVYPQKLSGTCTACKHADVSIQCIRSKVPDGTRSRTYCNRP